MMSQLHLLFATPHELSNGTKFNVVHPHFYLRISVTSKMVQISCLEQHARSPNAVELYLPCCFNVLSTCVVSTTAALAVWQSVVNMFNPLPTNDAYMCHETFSFMMSYPAMSLEDGFCMSRMGGTGRGGWVHQKGANSMAMSGLGCERPLAGAGGPFLLF